MVYITTANASKIVRKIDPQSLARLQGTIYEKPIYIYSFIEKQQLLGIKEFLRNPALFIDTYYVDNTALDSGRYVTPEKPPSYHFSDSCGRLHSDWFNHPIPIPIYMRGWDEIYRFREWWKGNAALYEDNPERFYVKLSADFQVPLLQIERMNAPNTGAQSFEDMELPELQCLIEDLIKKAGRYYYQSEKNTQILKIFQKKTYLSRVREPLRINRTAYSDDEVRALLKEYLDLFKMPLQKLFIEYYKVKYNPKLTFEGTLLKRLGFKPCGECG